MGRIAYVNGRYLPHRLAAVHIEDRGYQFADGVYEVFAIRHGRLVDADRHFARLARSLAALRIAWPMAPGPLALVFRRLIERNGRPAFGALYLQVTRGSAPRNHAFPAGVAPVVVATVRTLKPVRYEDARQGVGVVSRPDLRWKRPDIKSVSLLPNVLGKQEAVEADCYEAWLVDERGYVTEGTASNAWIVTGDGRLVTHPADTAILNGITRVVTGELAAAMQMPVDERPFTLAEAKAAREAFLTSTTSFVKPVVRIDGEPVGDGRIGPVTDRLLAAYIRHVDSEGADPA
jgi:D-alanine transaminase